MPCGDKGKPAPKREPNAVIRADVFETPANAGKAASVMAFWRLYRQALIAETHVARRDLAMGRRLRDTLSAEAEALEPEIAASKAAVGAAPQQMARRQATAAIASWLSLRQNDISAAIARLNPNRLRGRARRRFEALPEAAKTRQRARLAELRHELSAINVQKLWLAPDDVAVMRKVKGDAGEELPSPVSVESRARAARLFRAVTVRHSWPRFERVAMGLDARVARIIPNEKSRRFAWWIAFAPPAKTGAAAVVLPVRGWGRSRADGLGLDAGVGMDRPGDLGQTVNLTLDRETGRLAVSLTRRQTALCAQTHELYSAAALTDTIRIDFGLRTLFATDRGDLVGRSFIAKLRPLADRAAVEAARMQKLGKKPR